MHHYYDGNKSPFSKKIWRNCAVQTFDKDISPLKKVHSGFYYFASSNVVFC